jgi:hypothetical protein
MWKLTLGYGMYNTDYILNLHHGWLIQLVKLIKAIISYTMENGLMLAKS